VGGVLVDSSKGLVVDVLKPPVASVGPCGGVILARVSPHIESGGGEGTGDGRTHLAECGAGGLGELRIGCPGGGEEDLGGLGVTLSQVLGGLLDLGRADRRGRRIAER